MRLLRSRSFYGGMGLLFLIGGVIAAGRFFGLPPFYQALGIITVLVIGMGILLVGLSRARRSQQAIEKSIGAQAQSQLQSSKPGREQDVEVLRDDLLRAIEKLKKSKLASRGRRSSALYALPWYVVIGPPGGGKTTAIANSGLSFPVGMDSVPGVGGTRNCDWFFADKAIFLDTAGRYVTDRGDAEEWKAFLDVLKTNRPRQPINGAVIGISISDLADSSREELRQHSERIRARLDDLITTLGVRFPVYLLFTKCDLIGGFVQFFGDLGRAEREKIWGATLKWGEHSGQEVRSMFETEFQGLTSTLLSLRNERLSRPRRSAESKQVYMFPFEFAALEENLSYFVGKLFEENPYQESPVLRGFYFTSGTQEGTPIDRVIDKIAKDLNLPASIQSEADVQEDSRDYFLNEVFEDVIVPDQYLVTGTSRRKRAAAWSKVGVTGLALALLAIFTLVSSQNLFRNRSNLKQLRVSAQELGSLDLGSCDVNSQTLTGALDFKDQAQQTADPRWYQLGMGVARAEEPALSLYASKVRGFVEDCPLRRINSSIRQVSSRAQLSDVDQDQLYKDLKASLLLTSQNVRLEEEDLDSWLEEYLVRYSVDGLAPSLSETERATMDTQLGVLMNDYVSGLKQDSSVYGFAESIDTERMRQLAGQEKSAGRWYQQLIDEGNAADLEAITLESILRGRVKVLTNAPPVNGLYTRKGWSEFVTQRIDDIAENPNQESWVLGRYSPSQAGYDPEAMKENLRGLYFRDYAREWLRFLGGIEVTSFRSLDEASDAMIALGDDVDSPIKYVLGHASNQTRFGDVLDAVPGITTPPSNEVERQFAWLHQMQISETGGDSNAQLSVAMGKLVAFGDRLREAGSDGQSAFDYVSQVLKDGGRDVSTYQNDINNLLRSADSKTRRALFDAPILAAWRAAVNEAQSFADELWRLEVSEPFGKDLATRYPFKFDQETPDASLDAFAEMFGPENGRIATFKKTYLNDLLRPGPGYRVRTWNDRGIALSPQVRKVFEKAEDFQKAFFSNGELPELRFGLKPSADHTGLELIELSVHGSSQKYEMGLPRQFDVEWPGVSGAWLAVTPVGDRIDALERVGVWAWFRLLSEAQVSRAGNQYELLWRLEDRSGRTHSVKYGLTGSGSTNAFENARLFFNVSMPDKLN